MNTNSISFLSWNLNLFQRSSEAPSDWRDDQTEAEVRKLVLRLDVDVVCFQELPAIVPYIETHDLAPANTVSHSGTIATLVRKPLLESTTSRPLGRFSVMTTFESLELSIANVHLEPGANGHEKRLRMLATIIRNCPTPDLIVVGDTNTRVAEESNIRRLELHGKRPPSPTWDSKANRFQEPDTNSRRFSAYFTRYFHSPSLKVDRVKVHNQPTKHRSKQFYLSDHFPMSGTVERVERSN